MSLLLLFSGPAHKKTLLDTAWRLLNDDEPAIALVTAHMACEIYTEQVMSAALKKRGIEALEDAITEFLPSNHLANDRVRKFYVALTGDQIQDETFWSDFRASATLRNQAVHHGVDVSREKGSRACEVAEKVLEHLAVVMAGLTS